MSLLLEFTQLDKVSVFIVHVMVCMHTQTGPQFVLSSDGTGVRGGGGKGVNTPEGGIKLLTLQP